MPGDRTPVVGTAPPYAPPVVPFLPFATAAPAAALVPARPTRRRSRRTGRTRTIARYQSWQAPYPLADAERFVAEMAPLVDPVTRRLVADRRRARRRARRRRRRRAERRRAHRHDRLHAGDRRSRAAAWPARPSARSSTGCSRTLGVHRVEASIDGRNLASARLIEGARLRARGVRAGGRVGGRRVGRRRPLRPRRGPARGVGGPAAGSAARRPARRDHAGDGARRAGVADAPEPGAVRRARCANSFADALFPES